MRRPVSAAIFAIKLVVATVALSPGFSVASETLIAGGYDKAEMAAAIQRAQAEVDDFIADLHARRSQNYAVKAPIEHNGNVEHFWLVDVSYANGRFTGRINNDPGIVSNVKLGQRYSLGKDEISDWMFIRDRKLHGNYTMRPLLVTMPKHQADQFRAMFAKP